MEAPDAEVANNGAQPDLTVETDVNHGLADFFRIKQTRVLETEASTDGGEPIKATKEVIRLVTLDPSEHADPSGEFNSNNNN